jgi:putative acetyltransferase
MENLLIRDFGPGDSAAFRQLNEAWIRHYFVLEPKDEATLGDPSGAILEKGGQILLAETAGEVVACCALQFMAVGEFEVAKMAVTEAAQGKRIGRRLLEAVIQRAEQMGAHRLYLETNRVLEPAVRLYESLGFVHLPPERVPSSPYARANVFMEKVLR